MTDSEKLDLILKEIAEIKDKQKESDRRLLFYVAQLKGLDGMLLDELERIQDTIVSKTDEIISKIS